MVVATGSVIILLAILFVIGALKRRRYFGRCMLFILCIVLFLAIAVEAAAVGIIYHFSSS